jgi:sugar transport protein
MTTAEITTTTLSEIEHRSHLRRALIASTVGTTIEWYDFLLYGQVTALVFGKLFFPKSDPLIGVLEAFAVFFIGFVGRPIGAAIFGHWGDRIGRKATLIATLLVTGLATVAVGLVPTYESIGIWGAILLTVIRLIQGIGVGGEWGGSVLLAMEWARTNCLVAAIRCAGGVLSRKSRGARVQRDLWRRIPHLGLAHSVLAQHHYGRDRFMDPARHSRNTSLPEGARRRAD